MGKKSEVRIQASVLSKMEKSVLVWIANRLPLWVTPDILTAIGFAGALLTGAGYILSNWGKEFLWLSSFGFVVNWFGDSLDGTLARVRKIERPTYGFYIDHNVDAMTALVIVVGAGMSPFLTFSVVMMVLTGYLLLCIFTYINTYLVGVLKISYSGMGPTELRLGIIIINTLFFFLPMENTILVFAGLTLKFFDLFALAIAFLLMALYLYYFFMEKKKYEKVDPPRS
jgi:archaetidylinositol phosphate synthase